MKRVGLALAFWASLVATAFAQGGMGPGPGTVHSVAASMVTPILTVGHPSSGPSATVVNYLAFNAGAQLGAWNTSTARSTPFPAAGTISGLIVNYPAGAGASGSYEITLVKNGMLSTGVKCMVASGTSTCSSVGTETVAAGDVLQWQSCPGAVSVGACVTGGTQTVNTKVQISAIFTSTASNESFISASGSTSNTTNTVANYMPFGGYVTTYGTTEAVVSNAVPTGGAIDKLYLTNTIVPGASKFWIATLFKNGASTSLQCSVTGTVAGAGVTSCNDTTHSVSVVATDTISIELCPQSSGTYGGTCSAGGTPAASIFQAAVRWVPTVAGESVFMNMGAAAIPFNNGTQYLNFNGGMGQSATETDMQNLSIGFTIKKLLVQMTPAPGGSASRTITLRAGAASVGTPGNVACTLTSALTTCSDSTNTYTAASSALIDWQSSVASGPAGAATSFKLSSVVTVP